MVINVIALMELMIMVFNYVQSVILLVQHAKIANNV